MSAAAPERHALIVIIALGESIVAIGVAEFALPVLVLGWSEVIAAVVRL